MHVDGGPVRWYVRADPTDGRAILFLHGFAGTGTDWDDVRKQLPSGWRGYAPDLPGHGESALPPAIGFDKFPAMVKALFDSLGLESAVFVGYSLGARLALSVAAQMPDLVDGLFLESPNPGLSDPSNIETRRRQDENDARMLEMEGLERFFSQWHERPVFTTRRGGPGWEAEVARKRKTNHARRLAQVMRGLGLSSQPDFIPALKTFKKPMLIIAGEKDEPYVEHSRRLALHHAKHRKVVLAPCGHNVHTEQPLVFRDALQEFLRTLHPRGA